MRPVEIWSADKCQEHLAAEYFEPKTNKALCNSQKKREKENVFAEGLLNRSRPIINWSARLPKKKNEMLDGRSEAPRDEFFSYPVPTICRVLTLPEVSFVVTVKWHMLACPQLRR